MLNRTPTDGEPYYCQTCGLGWQEYCACEQAHCDLESKAEAMMRYKPVPQPEHEVGDYSDMIG